MVSRQNSNNRVVARDKARRYSKLSTDYVSWAPQIKSLVNEANNDDWGTFIAACALLEDAASQQARDEVERQIKFDAYSEEYVNDTQRKDFLWKLLCTILAGVAAGICALLAGASLHMNYFILVSANTVFTPYGLAFFMAVGAMSAGFVVGAHAKHLRGGGFTAGCLACFAGVLCAFICLWLPPCSLILAWAACHASDIMKPRVTAAFDNQMSNREVHGQRIYARNRWVPAFVKRALRFAGIYQGASGEMGDLARQALQRQETDYGAFVMYEALLSDYHDVRCKETIATAERAAEDDMLSGNNEQEATATLQDNVQVGYAARREIIGRGILAALVATLVLWGLADNGAAFIEALAQVNEWASPVFVVAIIVVAVFIGWRSATRVVAAYGLAQSDRLKVVTMRSAWFSAWIALVGIYGTDIALTMSVF